MATGTLLLYAKIATAAAAVVGAYSAVTAKDPESPEKIKPIDAAEERKKAMLAAKKKKVAALGAYGSKDTNVTGGVGAGLSYKGSKSLIGN